MASEEVVTIGHLWVGGMLNPILCMRREALEWLVHAGELHLGAQWAKARSLPSRQAVRIEGFRMKPKDRGQSKNFTKKAYTRTRVLCEASRPQPKTPTLSTKERAKGQDFYKHPCHILVIMRIKTTRCLLVGSGTMRLMYRARMEKGIKRVHCKGMGLKMVAILRAKMALWKK